MQCGCTNCGYCSTPVTEFGEVCNECLTKPECTQAHIQFLTKMCWAITARVLGDWPVRSNGRTPSDRYFPDMLLNSIVREWTTNDMNMLIGNMDWDCVMSMMSNSSGPGAVDLANNIIRQIIVGEMTKEIVESPQFVEAITADVVRLAKDEAMDRVLGFVLHHRK